MNYDKINVILNYDTGSNSENIMITLKLLVHTKREKKRGRRKRNKRKTERKMTKKKNEKMTTMKTMKKR